MATLEELVDEKILPYVEAASKDGFTVYVVTPRYGKAGFVTVCLDKDGSYAHIQVPTHSWDPVSLDAPIKPSRDYGSSVLVDYDGTVEDALKSLRTVCQSPNVTVRFVAKRGQAAPIVPNYGPASVGKWSTEVIEFAPEGN